MDNDEFRRWMSGAADPVSPVPFSPVSPEPVAPVMSSIQQPSEPAAPVVAWPELLEYDGRMVALAIAHDRPDVRVITANEADIEDDGRHASLFAKQSDVASVALPLTEEERHTAELVVLLVVRACPGARERDTTVVVPPRVARLARSEAIFEDAGLCRAILTFLGGRNLSRAAVASCRLRDEVRDGCNWQRLVAEGNRSNHPVGTRAYQDSQAYLEGEEIDPALLRSRRPELAFSSNFREGLQTAFANRTTVGASSEPRPDGAGGAMAEDTAEDAGTLPGSGTPAPPDPAGGARKAPADGQ